MTDDSGRIHIVGPIRIGKGDDTKDAINKAISRRDQALINEDAMSILDTGRISANGDASEIDVLECLIKKALSDRDTELLNKCAAYLLSKKINKTQLKASSLDSHMIDKLYSRMEAEGII
jgi:hypothetical protein